FVRGADVVGADWRHRLPAPSDLGRARSSVHCGGRGRAAVRDPVPSGEVGGYPRRAAGELAGANCMTAKLTLLPACDVAGGKAVMAAHGPAGNERSYRAPVA